MFKVLSKLVLSVTILVSTFLLVSGCNNSNDSKASMIEEVKAEIEVIEPWLRQMPEGFNNTAGFMTIKNNTGKPLILEDVSIDWARMGMIHESKVVDGMAKMEHQDQLTIIDSLEFKPGGLHIMVMGIKEPLKAEQEYNILLHFADREPLAVAFKLGQANQ